MTGPTADAAGPWSQEPDPIASAGAGLRCSDGFTHPLLLRTVSRFDLKLQRKIEMSQFRASRGSGWHVLSRLGGRAYDSCRDEPW